MTAIADLSNGPKTLNLALGECYSVLILQNMYLKNLFAFGKKSLLLPMSLNVKVLSAILTGLL
jgi:hypothetical protein